MLAAEEEELAKAFKGSSGQAAVQDMMDSFDLNVSELLRGGKGEVEDSGQAGAEATPSETPPPAAAAASGTTPDVSPIRSSPGQRKAAKGRASPTKSKLAATTSVQLLCWRRSALPTPPSQLTTAASFSTHRIIYNEPAATRWLHQLPLWRRSS